ncbi:3-oxo-5-alpha-steroid 4-dehydrogenase-domain-containing protein [Phycomyces blakesleeanus]|uniref:3-oxo-5-alpha-steroid 4-dehydrogenase-domain-containing protein n=1 Tax=Phycomyces blakesleeanus TaxID=4837 RepID=A0ABR3B9V7_PHYBL
MYLIIVLCGCLAILTILSFVSKHIALLRSSVLAYGKLDYTADQPLTAMARWIKNITVPKTWFCHFYAVGLMAAIECIIEITLALQWKVFGPVLTVLRLWDTPQGSRHLGLGECLVGLGLMTIHLARRLYESMMIERPSANARMHFSHYLAGMGFYGAMVIGAWLEGAANFGIWQPIKVVEPFTLPWTTIPSIGLFIYASYHQHTCHKILASLRTPKTRNAYVIPRGDWFENLVVPHYFADILVYVSLWILYQGRNWTLTFGLVWTIVNLGVTAGETDQWYRKTFGKRYNDAFPRSRSLLLPHIY